VLVEDGDGGDLGLWGGVEDSVPKEPEEEPGDRLALPADRLDGDRGLLPVVGEVDFVDSVPVDLCGELGPPPAVPGGVGDAEAGLEGVPEDSASRPLQAPLGGGGLGEVEYLFQVRPCQAGLPVVGDRHDGGVRLGGDVDGDPARAGLVEGVVDELLDYETDELALRYPCEPLKALEREEVEEDARVLPDFCKIALDLGLVRFALLFTEGACKP